MEKVQPFTLNVNVYKGSLRALVSSCFLVSALTSYSLSHKEGLV